MHFKSYFTPSMLFEIYSLEYSHHQYHQLEVRNQDILHYNANVG